MEKNFLIILFALVPMAFFLIGFVTHILTDKVDIVYGYQYQYQTQEQIEQKYDNSLLNEMVYNNCIATETSKNPNISNSTLETTCNAYVQELQSGADSMSRGMDQVIERFDALPKE